MLFGLLGLSVFLFIGGRLKKPDARGFIFASVSGLFFSLDIYFWHKSIALVGPGLSTLLANFQVFFLAFIDIVIYRQKPSAKLAAAVLFAVTGLYLLVGAGWSGQPEGFQMGVVYGLLTAAMYSGYIVFLRMAGSTNRPVDKRMSMLLITFVSCIALGVSASAGGESLVIPDAESWIYLVSYGVLCQAVGWLVIASALPKAKLTISGLVLLLQPTLAYVWDILIFNKVLTLTELSGAAIAVFAIYLGTLRNTEK